MQFIQKVMDVRGHQVQVGSNARPVAGDGNNNPPAAVQPQRQEQPDVQMDDQHYLRLLRLKLTDQWVKIAGVEVFWNSSIAVLKAACSFLQVSQAGSKQKTLEENSWNVG